MRKVHATKGRWVPNSPLAPVPLLATILLLALAACAPSQPSSEPASPRQPTVLAPITPTRATLDTTELGSDADPYRELEQVYVDPEHGSDSRSGSREAPLRTLEAGLERALANRSQDLGTRIVLYPGTYREGVDLFFHDSRGALIVMQALEPGTAIISGSDVWHDWDCSGSLCHHTWPHQWSEEENPWPEASISPLGLRREMIFVNSARLEQRLSLSEVQELPGSFYIDETDELVYMHLPSEVAIDAAVVEVAVRPRLFWAQGLHDLVIKGLVFQHAATPISWAAVYIVGQDNVLVEDVVAQHNNWDGLTFFGGSNLTLRRSTLNHNGASGTGAFRTQNLLLEDNETSHNNWRGSSGGVHGWAIGQKFMVSRDLVIRRHIATHNLARGLWLDWDVKDALLEEVYLCDNRNDGIFIEASQGPITVRNSTFCRNGRSGILTSSTHNLTLENNLISGNAQSQLHLSGSFDVNVQDFITGETRVLNNENWVWRGNIIAAIGDQFLISTTFPKEKWGLLMKTSDLDYSLYDAELRRPFQLPDRPPVNFAVWKQHTEQDNHSVFNSGLLQANR